MQARLDNDMANTRPTSSVQAGNGTKDRPQSIVEPLTPTSQAGSPDGSVARREKSNESDMSLSDSTSDVSITDSDDPTSSSGTSSPGEGSDSESPEQLPMKRSQAQRVPPPKRPRPRQICRTFQRKGSCKFGAKCRDIHERPDKSSNSSKAKGQAQREPEVR